jgi:hypothetical protein
MNSQDRQLLDALNRRHLQLEIAVAELKADLREYAARLEIPDASSTLPPPPPLPDLPVPEPEATFSVPPPIPAYAAAAVEAPAAPQAPPPPTESAPFAPEGPGFEIQFGRWLARIGVVFALLTLVFFSVVAYKNFYQYFGPWSKLGVLALVSGGLFGVGLWLERKGRDLVVYGRTLAGGGLACLYYTLYGATYVRQLAVIHDPLFGGFLLLVWSAGVLYLAEQRKSELLSIFAISLAYFSSAITPVGGFTMVADLMLAATAVIFLVRNSWTGLSYLCLIGTYLGFVRETALSGPDASFAFNFDHDPALFWPWIFYLTGAWLIFTAGVFLARGPGFDGGKRLAFLSLNNGAWAGLLAVAAELTGHGHLGGLLLIVGAVLLGAYGLARLRREESPDLANAYLLQGLAIGTTGVVVAYHGMTRGILITAESVVLAVAGATSRNPALRLGAGVAALLGVAFLLGETIENSPFPWWLMASGIAAMLANAWVSRRYAPAGESFSLARAVYVGLAVILGVRWIYGVAPTDEITLALLGLATAFVGGGLLGSSGYLLRAGLVLDVAGIANYLCVALPFDAHAFTWLDASAFALFLAQPALLRHWGRELISDAESWLVVIASSGAGWLFVSNSISAADAHNLTLGWAIYALAVTLLGFAASERRQRWCGLGILAAAFVRVAVHDFWGFSDAGKVLTFFALTVVCLGLSFLYYKFADRWKEWL